MDGHTFFTSTSNSKMNFQTSSRLDINILWAVALQPRHFLLVIFGFYHLYYPIYATWCHLFWAKDSINVYFRTKIYLRNDFKYYSLTHDAPLNPWYACSIYLIQTSLEAFPVIPFVAVGSSADGLSSLDSLSISLITLKIIVQVRHSLPDNFTFRVE